MTRLDNITTCLPIAYGSVAFSLGEKADEYHTHRWTLFLRSPNPTYDISNAISRVIFQLHPSFAQPTRELTKPPFEVTETGWGEFEASIRIVWREGVADERCTILTHGIKLYPSNNSQLSNQTQPTDVAVVSEKYDEVVFTNPEEEFHRLLLEGNTEEYYVEDNENAHGGGDTKTKQESNSKTTTATSAISTETTPSKLTYPLSHEPSVIQYFRTYGDEQDVQAMIAAKQFLEKELRNVKDRLMKADEELEEVKAALTLAKGGDAGIGTATAAATSSVGVVGVTGAVGESGHVGSVGTTGVDGAARNTTVGKSGGKLSAGAGVGVGRPKKSKAKSTTVGGESVPSGKKSKTAAAATTAA